MNDLETDFELSLLSVLVFIECCVVVVFSADLSLFITLLVCTLVRAGAGTCVNLLIFIVLIVNAAWRSPRHLFNKLF